jgi:toxin ParE1/3/4
VPRELIVRPQANRDLAKHADYLGRGHRDVGRRFLLAARATFRELVKTPGFGEPYEIADLELSGLRRTSASGFPNHVIYYRPTDRAIEVIRVLHGAQDAESELNPGPGSP